MLQGADRVLEHSLSHDVAMVGNDQRPDSRAGEHTEHHGDVRGMQVPDIGGIAKELLQSGRESWRHIELGNIGPAADSRDADGTVALLGRGGGGQAVEGGVAPIRSGVVDHDHPHIRPERSLGPGESLSMTLDPARRRRIVFP